MSGDNPKPSESNPYEVAQVATPGGFTDRDRPPGPLAMFFSVVLGLAVAAVTFGVTFFFTCLGVGPAAGAEVIVFGVAGLTAVGAFVFTVWGLLKLGKLFRS